MSGWPNLVIIGAMKAATTSLHHYLSKHPQIEMSEPKELDFFVEELNWSKGPDWYRAHFSGQAPVRGESSPKYTLHPFFAGVAERMASRVPDARLIYVVRDPIERLRSHYEHEREARRETRGLEEALEGGEKSVYIAGSLYYFQLERYLPHFPKEKIMVLQSEELDKKRPETLKRVFRFLGVDESFHSDQFDLAKNRTTTKLPLTQTGVFLKKVTQSRLAQRLPTPVRDKLPLLYEPFVSREARVRISDSMRKRLAEAFRDDMRRLRQFTGHEYPGWSC